MQTIWKYPLAITERASILVPKGATFLDVQVQRGIPCLWALVDSAAPEEDRTIVIHGTGHLVGEGLSYIGTVQAGSLVWHVFEKRYE